MPELEQLRCLAAFARHGTLSAAAQELHISQPSLSRSMQALERELQVTLFQRTKNKMSFNENGRYAAAYAERILAEVDAMTGQLRALDRARHTIAIGSCAPAPLWVLLPELSRRYSGMTISSEVGEEEALLDGLLEGRYQIIVLPWAPDRPECVSVPYLQEHLLLSVPPTHPLASHREGVWFREFDGENMIVFSEIGFWHRIHRTNLPHSRFLVQSQRFDFQELAAASVLPHFNSDLTLRFLDIGSDRVHLPILDKDATASYSLVSLKREEGRLKEMMRRETRP